MSAALDRLKAEVAQNTTVTQSVLTMANGISSQLRELAGKVASQEADERDITALADTLDANTASLAGAVAKNTPAEGEQAPTVSPENAGPVDQTPLADQTPAS